MPGKTRLLNGPMAKLHVPVILLAVMSSWAEADSPPGKPAEKLILGFERAELARGSDVSREEKPGRDSWFYLLEQAKGFDFAARFEWPGATNRAWTWRCRPGEHTEGELALVTSVGPPNTRNRKATYRQTEFLSRFYPDTRERFEAHRVMTTFQWLAKADPALRDWSGYERLWVDVLCNAPAELWLALEDDLIEPPVMRTFRIPEKQWVTLEVNLSEAVRARGHRAGQDRQLLAPGTSVRTGGATCGQRTNRPARRASSGATSQGSDAHDRPHHPARAAPSVEPASGTEARPHTDPTWRAGCGRPRLCRSFRMGECLR